MGSSLLYFFALIFVQSVKCKPLLFIHYMPWFQYPSNAYHWPPKAGTYYLPIIGVYSSQNITVIDWQISLMEYIGVDGIIIDWYGTSNMNDYPFVKNTTDIIWNQIQTKFTNFQLGICYDLNSNANQTIFKNSLTFLKENYFNKKQYLKDDKNNPLLLIWPSHQSDTTMQTPSGLNNILNQVGLPNLSVYMEFRNPAFNFNGNTYDNLGVFNWVYPQSKKSDKQTQIDEVINDMNLLFNQAKQSPYNSELYLQSMYHGFSDHYEAAGTGTTNPYNKLGFIDLDYNYLNLIYDNTTNKNQSIGGSSYLVQIPTWNDYSEGTMIEPNIPTNGCIKGCNDDTVINPYNDLIQLYKIFVDSNANDQDIKQNLEAITKKYFPNL
eukprot:150452_1